MAYYLSEINERCRLDAAAYVAECNAVYHHELENAADRILSNYIHSPIVLLSGPSGSGKTTTSKKISEILAKRHMTVHYVAMDDYFVSVGEDTPRLPDGGYDLESPLCLDMELLNDHFSRLSRGEKVFVPSYDFTKQRRDPVKGHELQLKDDEIVVFEGIHALNDMITDVHPEAYRLYISARSNVLDDDGNIVFKGTWMRLMRRTIRDYLFRGTAAEETLERWASVRRGEKLYISPYKDKANLQFDSSFGYEVPMMNNTVTELFKALPADTPRYEELVSILPAFELFEDSPVELLPKDAMLREFMGGGIY